jgi:hypothetical protein
MPSPDPERLRGIKTFPSLVKYLRDDLDWPIESENFDDLTFDFEPKELGIDPKTSAKIESIKQLRPLSSNQPWGIFFVKFEPKKLPVVALRRILGQLVIKKRASANRADQQTWRLNDLLFLSNYGENEQRQITFAHFSGKDDSKNLPTLKVLGWDDSDTALHIDHVHTTLENKLRWPDDENNVDTWRKAWSSAFTLRHREVIETSKELAVRLAGLAQQIRKRANAILSIETENGPLRKLMKGFKEALIHDLTKDAFADMYAQTIAYGLLSARITNPKGNSPDELSSQLPLTNPFLKELMESFLSVGGRTVKSGTGSSIDFDELGINEVVSLLDNSNMEAVIRDFGDKNPLEDPVIHFYELFLHEYDSEVRMQRGVFYTPRPIVSFIVRSVDEILRTEFGLEDGLADTTTWDEMEKKYEKLKIPEGAAPDDPFIQILDPATGTGTFLVEVVDLIHNTMIKKWGNDGNSEEEINQLWNDYVPKNLLPRLHGYELLMAPYAIAHMKIGLKLYETGYSFSSDERTQIYLTNALEPPSDSQRRLTDILPALSHEATVVNNIKLDKRFTVVIGNPPYANFGQLNKIPFILELLKDYKRDLREKKINLDDDFIKFVRFSQYLLNKSNVGIHGMITNNVYLDGVTHRMMRLSLLSELPLMHIFDLHGNASAKERAPDGGSDENVFDIKQGVAVALFANTPVSQPRVEFEELKGKRSEKYTALGSWSTGMNNCQTLCPENPNYFFAPKSFKEINEYSSWFSLKDIFQSSAYGIQTKRDAFTLSFTKEEIQNRVRDLKNMPEEELREKYNIGADGPSWSIQWAKEDVARLDNISENLRKILYRPFDFRWTLYTKKSKGFLGRPRWDAMSCMLGDNIGLISMRQVFQDFNLYSHIGVSNHIIDERTFYSNRGGTYLFTLYRAGNDPSQGSFFSEKSRETNLDPKFVESISSELYKNNQSKNNTSKAPTPEDIFYYMFAVFSSTGYRTRYKEFLKIDYPRLPITRDHNLFEKLFRLGAELSVIQLMNSPILDNPMTTVVGGEFRIEQASYSDSTIWIDKSKKTGFSSVPKKIWEFSIGGYQVCHKWLKDRGPKKGQPGRTLTKEEIAHYQKVIVAISETIRIMAEIDEVIEEHGGWPDAFIG